EVGVPVHQPAGAADLTAGRGQARANYQVVLDGLLEPDVDVVQASARARRRVAALQGQPGVGRRQERDVLDRVFDVRVVESGDVEIRRVIVGLDQARQDGAAAGVDRGGAGRWGRGACDGPGVGDTAIGDNEGGVGDGRGAGAVHELAVANDGRAFGGLHGS